METKRKLKQQDKEKRKVPDEQVKVANKSKDNKPTKEQKEQVAHSQPEEQ